MLKKSYYNIILVDFQLNSQWIFPKILNEVTREEYKSIQLPTNRFHGNIFATIKRIFWYFVFPLYIAIHRKRYNKIIGWQQFYGLNFAFYSRLFHLRKVNELTVMTFIYKKKKGWRGYLYHKYMSYIVNSKYIDRFICFSRDECYYYARTFNTSINRFVFTTVGIEPFNDIETEDFGYVFATGRSNRDYNFLIDVIQGTSYKCIIACDSFLMKDTEGVCIYNNCYGEEMIKLMARCHCVAIPLKDINVSSGQLVILQAMALGKPIICTESSGVKDYITHDIAVMLPNDIGMWRDAINKMYNNPTFVKTLGDAAKLVFYTQFTINNMYEKIAKIINTR